MSKREIKKIVITGGAGYIGNSLALSLPEEIEVIAIDNFHIDTEHKRQVNEQLSRGRRFTLIESNVSEVGKYEKHLQNVDVLVYLASLNVYKESNAHPLMYLEENNINLQTFINSLKDASPGLQKVILTSSRGVYGEGPYLCNKCSSRIYPKLSEDLVCSECSSSDLSEQNINENDLENPASYYGLTKKIQEDLMRMFSIQNEVPLDIFRIFNVYGEDQGKYYSSIGVIPQIYEQIKNKGEMYLVGNGELARDFVYIGDVVKVLLDSIFDRNERDDLIETYNLGSGQSITINDLAQFFEGLGFDFKRNNSETFGDIKYSVADNAKVSRVFKIDKFEDMYDFLKKNYEMAK